MLYILITIHKKSFEKTLPQSPQPYQPTPNWGCIKRLCPYKMIYTQTVAP